MENARRKALRSYLTQRSINGKPSRVILERAGCNFQPRREWLPKDEEQSSFINYISQQETEDSQKLERRLAAGHYICPAQQGGFWGKRRKATGVLLCRCPAEPASPGDAPGEPRPWRGTLRPLPALQPPSCGPGTGLGARAAQQGPWASSRAGGGKAWDYTSGRGLHSQFASPFVYKELFS